MELTGKCKEEFREYLLNGIVDASYAYRFFITIPQSMQYGVLIDYFDSVAIDVFIFIDRPRFIPSFIPFVSGQRNKMYHNRVEARDLAIEKANELRNEELNK